jgi:hypothetical protein
MRRFQNQYAAGYHGWVSWLKASRSAMPAWVPGTVSRLIDAV